MHGINLTEEDAKMGRRGKAESVFRQSLPVVGKASRSFYSIGGLLHPSSQLPLLPAKRGSERLVDR